MDPKIKEALLYDDSINIGGSAMIIIPRISYGLDVWFVFEYGEQIAVFMSESGAYNFVMNRKRMQKYRGANCGR